MATAASTDSHAITIRRRSTRSATAPPTRANAVTGSVCTSASAPTATGEPVSSADFALGEIPVLTSGTTCPSDDRREQIACAVWVMGSLIGTTTSHEVGHSLGLADPLGTRFHDLGDAPNRLMDAGGARTFEERAELMGQGPAMFCDDEYLYLREILPG